MTVGGAGARGVLAPLCLVFLLTQAAEGFCLGELERRPPRDLKIQEGCSGLAMQHLLRLDDFMVRRLWIELPEAVCYISFSANAGYTGVWRGIGTRELHVC